MSAPPSQEYIIRVPKNVKKRFHAMKFNSSLNVDFGKWINVKMERENNIKEYKSKDEEDLPKYGAGSEFGKEQREEARRKKYGIMLKSYKPEDQPWILKIGGKNGKKYKGIKEGGATENASYYVFTQASDGAFEAFPIEEWYNFTPIQRFNALSAEEAEEEFGRRDRVMNYFTIMLKKRLKNENDDENEEEVNKLKKKKKRIAKDLMVTDMDDWIESTDTNSENSDDFESVKVKKGGEKKENKNKTSNSDDEGIEDSDDGDNEGKEVDYISDASSEDDEIISKIELKGVDEEDASHKVSNSDDEENLENETNINESDNEVDKEELESKNEGTTDDKFKNKQDKGESSVSSESINSDSDPENSILFSQSKYKKDKTVAGVLTKTVGQKISAKRKNKESEESYDGMKRSRLETLSAQHNSLPSTSLNNSEVSVNEDSIRRYLMRKPMTTTELLQKFKSKKTGLSSEHLVTQIAQILKKINPFKKTIKGKMYLSIKN